MQKTFALAILAAMAFGVNLRQDDTTTGVDAAPATEDASSADAADQEMPDTSNMAFEIPDLSNLGFIPEIMQQDEAPQVATENLQPWPETIQTIQEP